VDIVIGAKIPALGNMIKKGMVLYEVNGEETIRVPSQAEGEQLIWIIEAPVDSGTRQYEIQYGNSSPETVAVEGVKQNGRITIVYGNKNLLQYQYETMYPPPGVDSSYKRSAFIHPLWTPHGQVLTRIQPPDHYHHYGIWNPWTHVLFEGDTIDFWNLKKELGTVRFAGFTSLADGPVFSEYEALHEHVVLKGGGGEKIALKELQKVRVYRPHNDYYIVDLISAYSCASESPFTILEYRYAGLGWRATGEWHKGNSEVLTSTGKTRTDADGSRERWYLVQGELGTDFGGVLMMSHTANFNHPEPVRIWPVNLNDRGDVFASFAPTKNTDWLLEPGKTYVQRYRFIVFNGKFTAETAENAWRNYTACPCRIKIQ
jgi:hypothetical protein